MSSDKVLDVNSLDPEGAMALDANPNHTWIYQNDPAATYTTHEERLNFIECEVPGGGPPVKMPRDVYFAARAARVHPVEYYRNLQKQGKAGKPPSLGGVISASIRGTPAASRFDPQEEPSVMDDSDVLPVTVGFVFKEMPDSRLSFRYAAVLDDGSGWIVLCRPEQAAAAAGFRPPASRQMRLIVSEDGGHNDKSYTAAFIGLDFTFGGMRFTVFAGSPDEVEASHEPPPSGLPEAPQYPPIGSSPPPTSRPEDVGRESNPFDAFLDSLLPG